MLKSRRGQTIVEFAIAAPVLLLLILGILEGSFLLFCVGTARFAAASAARLESEQGNATNADSLTIQSIRNSALGTTTLANVEHIDIYRLTEQSNGSLLVDNSRINSYRLDGSVIGAITWPSTSRNVVNGQSDFLGITIYYNYPWKSGRFLQASPLEMQQTYYIRLEPQTYA